MELLRMELLSDDDKDVSKCMETLLIIAIR